MLYLEKLVSLDLSAVMEGPERLSYNLVVRQYNDDPKTYTFYDTNALRDFIRSQIVEVT